MSMAIDFGLDDTDGPDRDGDFWYEEEDVLIAEVTHSCCGEVRQYFNCDFEDVPPASDVCWVCAPKGENDSDFHDPFAEEESAEEARLRMTEEEREADALFDPLAAPVRDPFSGEWV